MICQDTTVLSPPQRYDSLESKFPLNLNSNAISKRHTIATFYESDMNGSNRRIFFQDSGLHPNEKNTTANRPCRNNELLEQQTNQSRRKHKYYWETIESHYTSRLGALEKDIETATQQNSKLSIAREELVQEILKLHQKSMSLNTKNDALSRTIAEKENHISAFMYNQPTSSVQHHQDNYCPIVGVTLVDQPAITVTTSPSTPPLPPPTTINMTTHDDSVITDKTTLTEAPVTKEPGIFRQLSLRLSSRRKRQHQRQPQEEAQHQSSSLKISEPIRGVITPSLSSSNSIFHPAVVVSSSPCNDELCQLADEADNISCKRKKNVIFGNDSTQQARSKSAAIPLVVIKCIEEIEARGLHVEGIYRKSGTLAQVKELQVAFDQNRNPKLSKYEDINVITSLLKLHLRELSTPLISNDFILPQSVNYQDRLKKTSVLFHNMPIATYCTIKFLVKHLKRVHENQFTNRMHLQNLAVIFGPTLLRCNSGNEEHQTLEMIKTVEFIIQESHILFADNC